MTDIPKKSAGAKLIYITVLEIMNTNRVQYIQTSLMTMINAGVSVLAQPPLLTVSSIVGRVGAIVNAEGVSTESEAANFQLMLVVF